MLAKKEIMNAMYYVLLRPVFYFGSHVLHSQCLSNLSSS